MDHRESPNQMAHREPRMSDGGRSFFVECFNRKILPNEQALTHWTLMPFLDEANRQPVLSGSIPVWPIHSHSKPETQQPSYNLSEYGLRSSRKAVTRPGIRDEETSDNEVLPRPERHQSSLSPGR